MYLIKHGHHRPAELIAIHLERLERDRAAAEAAARTAEADAGAGMGGGPGGVWDGGGPGAVQEGGGGGEPMEEDGPAAADEGRGMRDWQEGGAGGDASPVRRSRRPKVVIRGGSGQAGGCQQRPLAARPGPACRGSRHFD
jgi:hypothetical protein